MSRGQDFLGCSQDVFHRNQSDENEFCSQENWQGAVICLAQVNINVTVNLEVSRIYSGDSQEPELGGPCTVEDSFEPLGVSKVVT